MIRRRTPKIHRRGKGAKRSAVLMSLVLLALWLYALDKRVAGVHNCSAMVLKTGAYGAADFSLFPRQKLEPRRMLGDMKPRELPAMLERRAPEVARAGFGRGTVSVPGAAFHTIKRGMDGAREVVPTVQELRAELRARRAREREAQADAEKQRRIEALGQAPAKAVSLGFGSDATSGPSVQINGEINKFPAFDAGSDVLSPSPTFDVTA